MSYHLVDEADYSAPDYHRKIRTVKKRSYTGETYTDDVEGSSAEPNGGTIRTTFKTWRCGHCRALLVGDAPPKTCGKCRL